MGMNDANVDLCQSLCQGTGPDHERLIREAIRGGSVLGRVMRLAVHQMRSELAATERGHTGEAKFYVLHALADTGQKTVGELAQSCHVANPTVSKMLNSLEANGLIERRIDPKNRRVVHVCLTAAGWAMEARMKERFAVAMAQVLRPLTGRQLEDLIVAFGHLESLVGVADHKQEAQANKNEG